GGLAATNASGPLRARYGTLRDLLLGVRFVQADGVVTWGGAKVVKSVSGYDVPKLMVGALGTLGVLGELTLRLHPAPPFEATWLAAFKDLAAAQAFIARLVDSTVQPNRVELLNRAALGACGAGDAPAAVAVSIATAEEAVRAQGQMVSRFAREAGATLLPLDASFWTAYGRATTPEGAIALAVGTLVTLVGETAAETERAVAAAGPAAAITGSATLGSLRATFPTVEPRAVRALVERLRALVAPVGGSVIIQRAPAAVRAAVDPWGPLEPDAAAAPPGSIRLGGIPGAGPHGRGTRALAPLSAVGAPAARAVHARAQALPATGGDGGTARRRAAPGVAPGAPPRARAAARPRRAPDRVRAAPPVPPRQPGHGAPADARRLGRRGPARPGLLRRARAPR